MHIFKKKKFPQNTKSKQRMNIDTLNTFDPFAEVADFENNSQSGSEKEADDDKTSEPIVVHIRVQQRNGRKSITTLQGLELEGEKLEKKLKSVLKTMKKEFCCNGHLVQDEEMGFVLQLQGDQRENIAAFLVKNELVLKENIKMHGF